MGLRGLPAQSMVRPQHSSRDASVGALIFLSWRAIPRSWRNFRRMPSSSTSKWRDADQLICRRRLCQRCCVRQQTSRTQRSQRHDHRRFPPRIPASRVRGCLRTGRASAVDTNPVAGLSSQLPQDPEPDRSQARCRVQPADCIPALLPRAPQTRRPNATQSPIDKLKSLPPVQRLLAPPDKQRTMVLAGPGGAFALLMISS